MAGRRIQDRPPPPPLCRREPGVHGRIVRLRNCRTAARILPALKTLHG